MGGRFGLHKEVIVDWLVQIVVFRKVWTMPKAVLLYLHNEKSILKGSC